MCLIELPLSLLFISQKQRQMSLLRDTSQSNRVRNLFYNRDNPRIKQMEIYLPNRLSSIFNAINIIRSHFILVALAHDSHLLCFQLFTCVCGIGHWKTRPLSWHIWSHSFPFLGDDGREFIFDCFSFHIYSDRK